MPVLVVTFDAIHSYWREACLSAHIYFAFTSLCCTFFVTPFCFSTFWSWDTQLFRRISVRWLNIKFEICFYLWVRLWIFIRNKILKWRVWYTGHRVRSLWFWSHLMLWSVIFKNTRYKIWSGGYPEGISRWSRWQ